TVAVDRRKVRAAVERHAIGRQEHGHRPTSVPRHRLHGFHVNLVDVRPLFAVHLHADEVTVHDRRDVGVLERLALHHVAPVAGRVADREQERLVFGPRARERVVAPRIPVDGVVRVLQEIRARLVGEPIGAHPITYSPALRRPRANGRSATVARTAASSTRTVTAVPASACWRRTSARATDRPREYDHAALVTFPISASPASTGAPASGTVSPSRTSPRRRRLTWPRSRMRTITSWPM